MATKSSPLKNQIGPATRQKKATSAARIARRIKDRHDQIPTEHQQRPCHHHIKRRHPHRIAQGGPHPVKNAPRPSSARESAPLRLTGRKRPPKATGVIRSITAEPAIASAPNRAITPARKAIATGEATLVRIAGTATAKTGRA